MISLELSLPPTVNGLYKNIKRGRARTPRYNAWRTSAGWQLMAQRPERLIGPVVISYAISSKAKGDPDNYLKALNDLLVSYQVIEGDTPKTVRKIDVKVCSEVKEGVRVTIIPVSQDEAA